MYFAGMVELVDRDGLNPLAAKRESSNLSASMEFSLFTPKTKQSGGTDEE